MTCMLITAGALILFLLLFLKRKDPEPIFGIYSVPGKWYYLKYVLFSCLYFYRKGITPAPYCAQTLFTTKSNDRMILPPVRNTNPLEKNWQETQWSLSSWIAINNLSKNDAAGQEGRAGQGVKAIADPAEMDKAQPLSYHAKAFDAVFFISAKKEEGDEDKGVYVISGCERRPMGMCNGLFYIGLPGKGLLCSKKIPDTVLFGAPIGEFGAEGIKMTPIEPMKKWGISYRGQMWYQNDPSKVVDVDFNGEWKATSKHFDYDCDLYPAAVIRSIAKEKWSREYFEGLKTAHQSHYEQFGALHCKFKIGDESYEYTLPSFRDHSFGQIRDWSLMHRYAFHHIFLRDGTNITVGVICQPRTATSMEAGVVGLPNGEMLPVKWVDLKLYQHGEGGSAPRDYAFRMQAGDQVYTVQDLVEYESVHYVSQEWEARMVERFCKYVVNGVPGRGVSEFHYRHKDGRPERVAKDDPEWFRTMCHKTRISES